MEKKSKSIMTFTQEDYNLWVQKVCTTIEQSKLQAALKVNEELLALYFLLGKEILERQEILGWGAQVTTLLSTDLLKRYPGESGFSERNLKYMRQFAKEYPHFPFVQVPLAQMQPKYDTQESAFTHIPESEEDKPTIGLLLCTNKKNKKVEYSLRGNQQPLGVASYCTNDLPTTEEITRKLEELQNE